jgi:UDP-glucose 4-epimerase
MASIALVTGAHGFVGRHVAQRLARDGWRVVGLGHGSWTEAEWRDWGIAEWHAADVTLDALLVCGVQPEVVVHCAGSGSVGFSMAHPHEDFQRTVASTAAVLEFIRLHAPQARMVYPSSGSVYGIVEHLPIAESQPLAPVSPYGSHKLMAEELCRCYARNFGVAAAIVRLFSAYGPGLRKQLLWDACTKISRGETTFSGDGTETRDWLHIDDMASLLAAAGEHASVACPVVNGGFGQGASVREVLGELFAAFGRSDAPQFSGTARAGDPAHYVADMTHALAWGWQPRIAWREGVREYAEWFKSGAP